MSENKISLKNITKVSPIEYPHTVTKNPTVSVCVQTYQHVNYIRQCLDGILMQKTTFDFEILLGEDASKDGTREICIEYAKKHPNKIRLFLHNRKNVITIEGTPTGRYNFIYNLYKAKHKYIAIIEGDDYWIDEYKLQKQIDFLEANSDFSGCFHDTFILDEKLSLFRQYSKTTFYTKDTVNNLSLFHTSSFLFKNYNFDFPLCFLDVASSDMALFSMVSKNGKLHRIPNVMSVYRKTGNGVTSVKYRTTNHHQIIIKLWGCLQQYFEDEQKEIFVSQIKYHENEIVKGKVKKKILVRIKNKSIRVLKCIIG